ncbi:hypothetical protein GCM10023328_13900 [Modestobacter marinus]|uniref:Uncharacterized protein n=1 Tax=Modestobacter marinus TaxID=477641 RepID=A0A846LTL5_9ACTN|nr:dirigent protein [Modestobacter marinus]NIH68975.1 hypothetical protein [Modestobacter marinus]GGL78522.1 hypothetical protein GCM10011589_38240 [Modestobacter marinus]
MSDISRRSVLAAAAAVLTVPLLGGLAVRQVDTGPPGNDRPPAPAQPFEFDVSEDGTRFVFEDDPVFSDGLPAAGNSFVTQGWIYLDGTLGDHDGVVVDAAGQAQPEFPEEVIGEWTCWGFFIGAGAHSTHDAWVATTQVFEFSDGSTLTSIGTELPQQAGTVDRAVTGGTGSYAGARGEMAQTTNGHNGTDGVNADFVVHLADGSHPSAGD